ncbi:hypothetical protein N8T08_004594 [Aspergillus melleus]|uniref:Uncharacterized protein n=1 Tax=Aspergillus melleus TaxID=138277 RepID=A0ACC3B491_9EURO|nr:hypothetical protein N8T08_004594 [Aspergillus melleus]
MDWVQNHLPPQTEPIIDAVIREMGGRVGCRRVEGVGYCSEPEELQDTEGPLRIASAVGGFVFTPAKRYESEEIWDRLEVPYPINISDQHILTR